MPRHMMVTITCWAVVHELFFYKDLHDWMWRFLGALVDRKWDLILDCVALNETNCVVSLSVFCDRCQFCVATD